MDLNPLSPSKTRRILVKLDHRPQKNLGQNFLIDGNIVEKSLGLARVETGDRVIEVGPGLGTLTRGLLRRGATVYAVERDPALARWLNESLGDHPAFHLLEGDACDDPLGRFQPKPDQPYKIVANLPYAISSPWMEAVLKNDPLPDRVVILVQRETADRMTATPGSKAMGAIAVFLEAAFQRRPGHPVPASCFFPVPRVDSTLFHLSLKADPHRYARATREAIRLIFTLRRKQIGSSARKFLPAEPCAAWMASLGALGATPQDRPEHLPFAAWRELDRLL